jgi:hypothetical protein
VINVVVHLLHGLTVSNVIRVTVFLTSADFLHRCALRHHRRLVRTNEEIKTRLFVVYAIVLDAMAVFCFQIVRRFQNLRIGNPVINSVDSGRGALPGEKLS